jgi:hypothetical protein
MLDGKLRESLQKPPVDSGDLAAVAGQKPRGSGISFIYRYRII